LKWLIPLMSLKTRPLLAVGVAVVVVGLVTVALSQLLDYVRRAALAVRLTHEVGGPSVSPGSLASSSQLVLPGLEVVAAVVLMGVVVAALVRARSTSVPKP
jgi:hypothetical protein